MESRESSGPASPLRACHHDLLPPTSPSSQSLPNLGLLTGNQDFMGLQGTLRVQTAARPMEKSCSRVLCASPSQSWGLLVSTHHWGS